MIPLRPLLALLAACLAPPAAQAQLFHDAALQALYDAERHDELQRVAERRAAAQPDDAQAVLGLAMSALARNDAPARQAAIQRAEACIERQPRAAPCHYALGTVLGVQAMSEGLFKAARSAGTVRSALSTALDLEPERYPARAALVEFYLLAPGVMGGSAEKAAELSRAAPTPEQARALQARIALGDRRFEQGLQLLAGLPATLPPELAEDVRAWAVQCALGLASTGQSAQAQPAIEKLRREHGAHAGPAYALARLRGEQGAHEEALRLYEQAALLRGAGLYPVAYRIGVAQQALGRPEAARAALQRYVAAGRGQKASLDDARKRLVQLGG